MNYINSIENQVFKRNTENETATETLGELMKCFKVSIKVLQRHSLIEEYKIEVKGSPDQTPEVTPVVSDYDKGHL